MPSLKKVLLISANREHFPEPVFPLGISYIASALLQSGAHVRIFDAGLHPFYNYLLQQELIRFQPDVIGLSLRNIDNAAYPHTRCCLQGYLKIVKRLRAVSSAPIILGGAAFSIFPEKLMEILGADAGVIGEGEALIDRYLEHGGGKICYDKSVDLASVAFPKNINKIFPLFDRYRTIGIQTSRG